MSAAASLATAGTYRHTWPALVSQAVASGVAGTPTYFINGVKYGGKKDYEAVKAGLTLSWSNGQTEGQVHRLKLIKRQMYGRGSFTLLRKRVLHRAETKRRKRRAQKETRGLGRKPGDQAALAS